MTDLPVEDVQTYPRPPALEPAGVPLRVIFAGLRLAETTRALRVLETHHAPTYYIPQADIDMAALVPTARQSFCEWKGMASYFDLARDGRHAPGGAWCYRDPTPRFAALRDHVSFYAGAVDAAFVGDLQVEPQPGDFYGGWVTPNLKGRIKGAPGTRHW